MIRTQPPLHRLFRFAAGGLLAVALLGPATAPAAGETIPLTGIVLADDGSALAAATVALRTLEGEVVARAQTDAEGRYLLEAPAAGFWRVVVAAPGLASVARRLDPLLPPDEETPSVVQPPARLAPTAADPALRDGWWPERPESGLDPDADGPRDTVTGVVVDARTGAPIDGAFVWSRGDRTRGPLVRTDTDGRFRFEAATRAAVLARAPGFLIASWSGRDARAGEPLALAPAAHLSGTVTTPDGTPVADVRVSAEPDVQFGHRLATVTWTDTDGRYRLDGLDPDEKHQLAALHDGRTAAVAEIAPWPRDETGRPREVAAPELVLHAERGIAGRIVDTEGAPIEGARAALLAQGAPDENPRSLPADADGRFRFDDLPPMRLVLMVGAPGYAPRLDLLQVRQGGLRDLGDLALRPAQRIRGRVADSKGRPVAEAEVMVEALSLQMSLDGEPLTDRPRPIVTDADGRFEITGLMVAEQVSLQARADGTTSERVSTFSSADPQTVELVLHPLARLAGRVVRPDGTPAAGVWVGNYYGGSGPKPTRTDDRGRFALERLEPRFLHLLARQEGFAPSSILEIPVEPGTVRDDLELRLRTAHTLAGRVVTPTGEPLAQARLAVPPTISLGPTDRDGNFRFTEQPPGPMEIEVRHGDWFPSRHQIEIVPDMEPVEIVLPATEIAGVVTFADGSPGAGLTVRPYRRGESPVYGVQFDTLTAADGSFRLRGFPDGTYGLRITGPGVAPDGWLAPEPVVIEDGRSAAGLEIVLPER